MLTALLAVTVYGIAAPVIPFRLEHLGYSDVESLTGWLVAGWLPSCQHNLGTLLTGFDFSLCWRSSRLFTFHWIPWREGQEQTRPSTSM